MPPFTAAEAALARGKQGGAASLPVAPAASPAPATTSAALPAAIPDSAAAVAAGESSQALIASERWLRQQGGGAEVEAEEDLGDFVEVEGEGAASSSSSSQTVSIGFLEAQ